VVVLLLAACALTWRLVRNLQKDLHRAQSAEAQLQRNYDLTLEAWAGALDYRDKETEGHSRRVVDLSTRLAQAIGLSVEEISHLRRGALLHDIGKLAVPDEILLKPGELNDAERLSLQKHPVYAKKMLASIPVLQSCLDVPYSHHERWDGLGYPEDLQGEAIPLSARIFAVLDQWEALTSDRPFRKAWTREKVIAYMRENAGRIYDPEIVNTFLTII
jgi:HD-GYP domain-containing protein (c-di-GMP phosphodiesterase class II)